MFFLLTWLYNKCCLYRVDYFFHYYLINNNYLLTFIYLMAQYLGVLCPLYSISLGLSSPFRKKHFLLLSFVDVFCWVTLQGPAPIYSRLPENLPFLLSTSGNISQLRRSSAHLHSSRFHQALAASEPCALLYFIFLI